MSGYYYPPTKKELISLLCEYYKDDQKAITRIKHYMSESQLRAMRLRIMKALDINLTIG
jgi:hypothetical protein